MKSNAIYTGCRYFVAFMLIMYGFAKINDSQFTVVDWVLDEPLERVPGFWLTWFYFGYSTTFKVFISLVEIVGGIFLLFRRTTLIGSVILSGVMINIVLIDIFYQIDLGALIMAIILLCCLLVIIGHHWEELVDVFWTRQKPVSSPDSSKRSVSIGKGVVRGIIIILPIFLTYYIANYNNRVPTPIDGTWDIIEVAGEIEKKELPTRIYFEYNRAYQARFRYPDSLSPVLHFTVSSEENTLDIWEGWLSKDEKVFSGEYELRNDTLVIKGVFDQKGAEANVVLSRVR